MSEDDLLAACKLLITLVEELRDDPASVDPEWIEQVLASCRMAADIEHDTRGGI